MNFESSILNIPLEEIVPNRFQPRLAFNDDSLNELAESIKKYGIIQPIVLRKVNDKYEIIAGERRYRAAKLVGLSSVPAVITKIDDKTSAEVAIEENTKRVQLTSIEEAKSYKALLDQGFMTPFVLAQKMGMTEVNLNKLLSLLTLDEKVQEAVIRRQISERHARSLLKVGNKEKQVELLNRIINERLTVKQLDDIIKESGENSMDLGSVSLNNQPLDLGTQKTDNQVNDLETQSANMVIEEIAPSLDIPTFDFKDITGLTTDNNKPEAEVGASVEIDPIPATEEIDSLDSLDFEPPAPASVPAMESSPEEAVIENTPAAVPDSKNPFDALMKLNELANQLRNDNYNIDFSFAQSGNGYQININIK